MTSDRRDGLGFGRVVGLGLAAAGLAAVAGHHSWVGVDAGDSRSRALADATLDSGADIAGSPVAGSLALVVLACWGVLLVTRGRVRRAVAVLGALAALGLVAAVVLGASSVPGAVRDAIGPGTDVDVGLGPWFWVTALGALLSTAATALAVREVPRWPEMGSRYDAPGAPSTRPLADERAADAPTAAPGGPDGEAGDHDEDRASLELWKAIGEGRDPTL